MKLQKVKKLIHYTRPLTNFPETNSQTSIKLDFCNVKTTIKKKPMEIGGKRKNPPVTLTWTNIIE